MPRWTQADLDQALARPLGLKPGFRDEAVSESAKSQCPVRSQPLGQEAHQGSHPEKLWIRVESVRRKLLDPDNLCGKAAIDCLRYAGVIRDDTEKDVRVEAIQRKAKKGEEEHTMIHVWRI